MIVDDEKNACERLSQLVSEIPGCYVQACAYDGLDAVRKADALELDVVLMDIHIPAMNGLEAARHMKKSNHPPQVIFTTAYRQYALSAFEVDAKGFLLKPVARRQLREKLDQLQQKPAVRYVREARPNNRRSHIYCRSASHLELVALEDIIYFKSEHKYTKVRHIHGSHLIEESLKQLEHEFSDFLIRVHRNALVNKDYMRSMEHEDRKQARLGFKCTDDTLPLSRRYIPIVRAYIRRFAKVEDDGEHPTR